jgi:hypothetical protein
MRPNNNNIYVFNLYPFSFIISHNMVNAPPNLQALLGSYRALSPSAGVKVSPLCLGHFGEGW